MHYFYVNHVEGDTKVDGTQDKFPSLSVIAFLTDYVKQVNHRQYQVEYVGQKDSLDDLLLVFNPEYFKKSAHEFRVEQLNFVGAIQDFNKVKEHA